MKPENLLEAAEVASTLDALIVVYLVAQDNLLLLERIKKMCLEKAKPLMGDQLLYISPSGTCGLKSPTLDKSAWTEAMLDNPDLFAFQIHYEKAEKRLHEAQKPFMKQEVGIW